MNANDTSIYAFDADGSSEVENNVAVNGTYDGITVDASDGLPVENNKTNSNDQGIGVYERSAGYAPDLPDAPDPPLGCPCFVPDS